MDFSFITKSKKDKIVAIFDVGTSSVSGALVKISKEENKLPTILKSSNNEIRVRKDFEFDLFIEDMVIALRESVQDLYNKKAGAPEEIYCFLASPWYLSETRTIKISEKKPFIFSKRMASKFINNELHQLDNSYKEKYNELDSIPEMIENHPLSVSLNGYHVQDPIGKRCNYVEINMIISLAPKLCLDKMRGVFSDVFHHTPVSFASFTVATYFAVRDRYVSPDSYLLLDVSGEITDVGIVNKHILKSVLSFPFGKKTFFNYICTKMEIELRDAKELFRMYNDGSLSSEYKIKAESLFKSIENSWGEAFNECIATLPKGLVLPNTIFLTADNDIRKWFAGAISNDDHIKSAVTGNKCNIITLDGPEFLNMCNVEEGGCDPFLMIESIAVSRKISAKENI